MLAGTVCFKVITDPIFYGSYCSQCHNSHCLRGNNNTELTGEGSTGRVEWPNGVGRDWPWQWEPCLLLIMKVSRTWPCSLQRVPNLSVTAAEFTSSCAHKWNHMSRRMGYSLTVHPQESAIPSFLSGGPRTDDWEPTHRSTFMESWRVKLDSLDPIQLQSWEKKPQET